MATTSRMKAAEVQLKTIISGRGGLTGVGVSRGHPGDLLQDEHVWIGALRWDERAASLAGGQNPRRQEITVEINVRVRHQGDDAEALRDRAYELSNEVEEALRANATLSGEVEFGGVKAGEIDSWQDTDGRVAAIGLDATYKARKG